MTAKVSDFRNVLYSREYSNDVYPQTNLVKRVALAALPFLSLYAPLRTPISLAMGLLRLSNTKRTDTFAIAMAVVSIAAAIFQHSLGMAVTTIHDVVIEINKLRKADNWEDALKSVLKIFNDLLFLAVITHGGLELSIIAFLMQAVINLIQSRDEFNNDRWIEGVSNLMMAAVRLKQSHGQFQQLRRNWEIEAAIKRVHVGLLHEKWRFPSDHLPVGVEVNGVRIISWNVLNNAFMEWVTDKDSQGLNGSMISDLNVPVNDSGLTKRDVVVADMVQNMMSQGQVVALQECSEPFLQHLQARLPSNWDLVRSFKTARMDQDVILYNKGELRCKDSATTTKAYPSFPGRPLQNVSFTTYYGKDIRIINSHIPGDPTKPGKDEFAKYVYNQHRDGSITVALGDNNFERHEMIAAYLKVGFNTFKLFSPWKTNIDPETKESKGIDHVFVMGDDSSRDLKPDEVLVGGNLKETIDLLF